METRSKRKRRRVIENESKEKNKMKLRFTRVPVSSWNDNVMTIQNVKDLIQQKPYKNLIRLGFDESNRIVYFDIAIEHLMEISKDRHDDCRDTILAIFAHKLKFASSIHLGCSVGCDPSDWNHDLLRVARRIMNNESKFRTEPEEPIDIKTINLYEYQKVAIDWMNRTERQSRSGELNIRLQMTLKKFIGMKLRHGMFLLSLPQSMSTPVFKRSEEGDLLVTFQIDQQTETTKSMSNLERVLGSPLVGSNENDIFYNRISQKLEMGRSGMETPRISCRGGFLADMMGMGKTSEVIGLIRNSKANIPNVENNPFTKRFSNASLIIVPATIFYQWSQALSKEFGPEQVLAVGNKKNASSS